MRRGPHERRATRLRAALADTEANAKALATWFLQREPSGTSFIQRACAALAALRTRAGIDGEGQK